MNSSLGEKIIPWLLTLYLGLAPIYWLPGIPLRAFFMFKLALVGLGVFMALMQSLVMHSNVLFPRGFAGPLGWILLVVTAAPGFFQGDPRAGFTRFYDSILIFVFTWTFFNLTHNGVNCLRIFWRACCCTAFFSLITILNFLTGFPDWRAPYPNAIVNSISRVGFHNLSSGWSNGIVLYFPVALALVYAFYVHRYRGSRASLIIGGGFTLAYVGTMFAVSGRTGLLAAAVVLLYVSFRLVDRWLGALISGTIAFFAIRYYRVYFDHLRFNRLQSTEMDDISRFSSGRVDGYLEGLRLFLDRPFLGHGFGVLDMREYGMVARDIHNLWLKMASDAGILFALVFTCLLIAIYRRYRDIMRFTPDVYARRFYAAMAMIIPCGVIVSNLSPFGIFGGFQNNAIFWAVMGYLLAKAEIKRNQVTAMTETAPQTTDQPSPNDWQPNHPITQGPVHERPS